MSCNEWKETEIGKIPAHWDFAPMKEYVEINMGQSPKSEFYNTAGEGLPFLQGNRTFGIKYPYYDTYSSDIKKIAQEGDILFSVRAPVGDVNIATEKFCIGRGIASLRMKNGNQEYLYYLLREYRKYIENRESGTVFGSINKKGLEELKLPFPPKEEQEKIANILSSLDTKIELNNEMNKTLEEMAQSIFKRWFVDFEFPSGDGEPYKSSGGEMVDSELGMIPKGWEVKPLRDTDIVIEDGDRGKNYPKKSELLKSGYCPFLNNKNIIDDKISLVDSDFITEERHNLLRKGTININDIILTTRGSVGNIGIFNKYLGYEFARINSGMIIIKNKEDFNLMYLYQLLKTPLMKEQYKSMSTGTAQPQLPIKDIKKLKILKPDKSIQDKIGNLLSSIYDLVFSNDQESLNISIKRDLLLPKLMSGEISVN